MDNQNNPESSDEKIKKAIASIKMDDNGQIIVEPEYAEILVNIMKNVRPPQKTKFEIEQEIKLKEYENAISSKDFAKQATMLLDYADLQCIPVSIKEDRITYPFSKIDSRWWMYLNYRREIREAIEINFNNTITVYSVVNKDEIIRKPGDINGIAILAGTYSYQLDVIDIEFDENGTLWNDFEFLIREKLPLLYKKLVIVRTPLSFQLFYRIKNESLAKWKFREDNFLDGNPVYNFGIDGYRTSAPYSPDMEVNHLYNDNPTQSFNLAVNNNGERITAIGIDHPVIAHGTTGYNMIKGNYFNIPIITSAERDILWDLASSFNQN